MPYLECIFKFFGFNKIIVASDFPITLTSCNMLYYYALICEAGQKFMTSCDSEET